MKIKLFACECFKSPLNENKKKRKNKNNILSAGKPGSGLIDARELICDIKSINISLILRQINPLGQQKSFFFSKNHIAYSLGSIRELPGSHPTITN